LVVVVLIAPVAATQATPCNLQRSNLLTLYQTPGHQTVKPYVNNHCVNPMHYSGFKTPRYTKCVLTGPKHPAVTFIALFSCAFHVNRLPVTSRRYLIMVKLWGADPSGRAV